VRFCMLGPLEVTDGAMRLTPSRLKERTLLALLLANAGRTVSRAEVNHALWGGSPPASARSNLSSYATGLRRRLNGTPGAGGDRLRRTGGGYLLRVEDGEVDARVFEQLVRGGRSALKDGQPAAAVRDLDTALRLWRGSPLMDIRSASEDLRREVARFEELRLVAVEDMAEANLAVGHSEEVVASLPRLVDEYPLRERLWSLLMRAWYRTGRQSEALAAYQRVYRLLDDELGVEPGQELKRVHQLILSSAPEPEAEVPGTATVHAPVPRLLPVDASAFVGRERELAELDRLGADPSVLVLSGFAGVGKTALALRWARRLAGDFPDGQLYVDLRGYSADRPLSVAQAQARLLAPFGVSSAQVPADPHESTALFRSVLAERRVLVVLDNALSAEQVRPLLPGTSSCRTLVTSRDLMTGLVAREGAHRTVVAPLPLRTAVAVLARIIGQDRAMSEEPATVDLVRLCGCVPLALRVAAANLADDPARGIADYVEELVHDGLFTGLSVDGDGALDVRVSIGHSYDRLTPGARTVFHVLANDEALTVAEVAARIATPPRATRLLLGELAAGHLAVREDEGRFTVTGLLRRYAHSRIPARRLMTVPAV
jgi:DNA-binding SARP family transcriptional activator